MLASIPEVDQENLSPVQLPNPAKEDIHKECQQEILNLKSQISAQNKEITQTDSLIQDLEERLKVETFELTRFSYDDNMIEFYTGFPPYILFMSLMECIKPAATTMKSAYYHTLGDISTKRRQRSIELVDELFMFLCRLKCGHQTEDLATRFHIHKSSVSRKIITWAYFLYSFLGSINIWPSRQMIKHHQPKDFATLYPRTRVIIDCTELFSEKPSSPVLSSKTFTNYKSHNTWKGLVGIAPHGAVTFISSLYSECMSDIEITQLSGLLDLMEPGDEIIADKGFVLNKLLEGTGVSITTPQFLSCDEQFSSGHTEDNQRIASLRIHVERHIKRVKEYRLLQSTVPLSIAGVLNQMWTVANLLTLFRKPLIKPKNN